MVRPGVSAGDVTRFGEIAIDARKVIVELPAVDNCELSVKCSLFDDLLLRGAREAGAQVREQTTIAALGRNGDW